LGAARAGALGLDGARGAATGATPHALPHKNLGLAERSNMSAARDGPAVHYHPLPLVRHVVVKLVMSPVCGTVDAVLMSLVCGTVGWGTVPSLWDTTVPSLRDGVSPVCGTGFCFCCCPQFVGHSSALSGSRIIGSFEPLTLVAIRGDQTDGDPDKRRIRSEGNGRLGWCVRQCPHLGSSGHARASE
jgi:hypothetical protein